MTDSTSNSPNRIDPDMETKRLVMIQRSGPAFDPNEISKAHTELDLAGSPRKLHGRTLSIRERIAFLRGRMEELRSLVGEQP